jgi:large subunit ribosomal protein L21
MEAYAVIETGGKQYRVEVGQTLEVERLDQEAGTQLTLDRVLAQSDGTTLKIGTPTVPGAAVTVEILEHFRGTKVVSFKKKRRKGYKKKIGHRQELTRIKIQDLAATGGAEPATTSDVSETAEV